MVPEHDDDGQDPVKQELVFQHSSLEDLSPMNDLGLEVIDLETGSELKVEQDKDSERKLEDIADDEKRLKSNFHLQGKDGEQMSNEIDLKVKGDQGKRGSENKVDLHGQRRRSRTLIEADNQGYNDTANDVQNEEKRQLGEGSVVKGQSSRLRSGSRSKSQDTDDEADKLMRSIDGREDTSPQNKHGNPSPRRDEQSIDKREMIRKRNSELAVMAKRLEEKAKEMKNRPTTQWKCSFMVVMTTCDGCAPQ
ncbi:uncharacterized protein LOC129253562 [Lytechinus pictus]|uniref:uncharacterized protein LOC129253562 n=1 Tax=Lytechinus pictus TaxID=7653 RepID=UPI0030B9DDCB